jgi:hypothetical protein
LHNGTALYLVLKGIAVHSVHKPCTEHC